MELWFHDTLNAIEDEDRRSKLARRWPLAPDLISFNIRSLGGIPDKTEERDNVANLLAWSNYQQRFSLQIFLESPYFWRGNRI